MRKLLRSDRYLNIFYQDFDYKELIKLMGERLEKNNNIYIVSVKADHNLHNPLEESYRNFASKNGNLKIVAGPIISVPETSKGKSQKERVFDNAVTRLASEGHLSLYPSDVRPHDQYGVFENENLVLIFERHHIQKRPNGVWFLENADIELNERIKYFNNLIEGKEPLTEGFDEKLLFLTYEEIGRFV